MAAVEFQPPSARVHALAGQAAVTLASGELAVTVVPELSMLGVGLSWAGERLVAPHRPLDDYIQGGHTLGVPLLHPWANRLGADVVQVGQRTVDTRIGALAGRDGNGLPMHGTMSARPGWAVQRLEPSPGDGGGSAVLSAAYAFDEQSDQLAVFPFPHRLSVTYELWADRLEVTVDMQATADVAVPVSFGWHPYLQLPGVERRDWVLDLPEREVIELDPAGLPTGASSVLPAESAPLADRSLDESCRLLSNSDEHRMFAIEGHGLRIAMEMGQRWRCAQVFAPTDRDVVALEPMMAPVDALRSGDHGWVEPGCHIAATFALRVSSGSV